MLNRQAFAFLALAGLVGCTAPYTVKRQSRPNPFAHHASFALMPMDFSAAEIRDQAPETPWTAREAAQFEHAKRSLSAAFEREVVTYLREGGVEVVPAGSPAAASAPFVVKPRVVEITPGDFTGMGGPSTHLRVNIAVSTRGGQVLDVVEVEHSTVGDPTAGDTRMRLTLDGSFTGERFASYLRERVIPGSELR
jgi:hypothetical protein